MTTTNSRLISVVLPFHNSEATLARAIRSIQNQTYRDWELLLADDGSTDSSPDIARSFSKNDPRIRLLQLPKRGIVPTLNDALTRARGKYIARMDSDDYSHPERFTLQIGMLNKNADLGLVSCLVRHIDSVFHAPGYKAHVHWLNTLITPEQHFLARFIESPVAHPSVLYRNELLQTHGSYSQGDFPEDYELWLRWLSAGVRFAKIPEYLLDWHDSPDRLSRTDARYNTDAFYKIKCKYLAAWLKHHQVPDRPFWLWGAGRITRKRFRLLEQLHRPFDGFIDIDPKKIGTIVAGRKVFSPASLRHYPDVFILAAVGTRGARNQIVQHLKSFGKIEGLDYLCTA